MKKKQIVLYLAEDIAYLVHVGLRNWTDDPSSGKAWDAISEMDDGAWEQLCEAVAGEIYPRIRRAFTIQFKENVRPK